MSGEIATGEREVQQDSGLGPTGSANALDALRHPPRAPEVVDDPVQAYRRSLPAAVLQGEGKGQGIQPVAEGGNATTFGATTLAEFTGLQWRDVSKQLHPGEAEYFRYGTPISRRVESALAELDCGEAAVIFRSGMAAIWTLIDTLMPLSREVAHFIVGREGYKQTRNILDRLKLRGHVELTEIPMDSFGSLEHLIQPNTKAIFFETPSNPFLKVIDVERVAAQVKSARSDALVVVDHTFANPLNQKPLLQGADVVVPSLTKYIGGDNRTAAGAVIGRSEIVDRVRELRSQVGNIVAEGDCLRVEQGLETLEERNKLSNRNALLAAQILEAHPMVRQVFYPGLPSHADHAVALRQMPGGFGGVVSFQLCSRDFHDVAAFIDTFLRVAPKGSFIGPSFGGEYPLISSVPIVSHFRQTPEERAQRGIPDDLVRLSVGTIPPEWLEEALRAGLLALADRRGS